MRRFAAIQRYGTNCMANQLLTRTSDIEVVMDTEKKPSGRTDQPKPEIGEVVGDLVVSTATVLANSAATAVVNRFKKAAAKSAPAKAVSRVVKKAKKSAAASKAARSKKAKKASRKSGSKKSAGKKAAKKSARKTTRKKSSRKNTKKKSAKKSKR